MSYFDSKQEVLKLELTSYGKYLLSKGKLKPVYYAFFDDEIIYDSEYAELAESQNETHFRILDETPALKPQVNFSNVEERATKNIDIITNNTSNLKEAERQISSDKKYALSSPIGKSSHNSEFYPAWHVEVLEGQVSSSISFIDNTNSASGTLLPFFRIPQINLENNTFDVIIKENEPNNDERYIEVIEPYYDEQKDKTYYFSMLENSIFLDVSELNVDNIKENFDIELFIEEEKIMPGSEQKVMEWKQLLFPKKAIHIKNGILLDTPENEKAEFLTIDSTFAAHYVNILVDDEIELAPKQKMKLNIYDVDTMYKAPYGEDC